MKAQYDIPEQNMAGLEAKIAKLNKRCSRLGVTPITVTRISSRVEEYTKLDQFDRKIKLSRVWTTVDVEGETPKYNGWEFVATLEHEAAGNIIREVSGSTVQVPEKFRTFKPWCEHCAVDRHWKDTYIIRHDDGRIKQVGRRCLRDFLGHQDPHKLAEYAEFLTDLHGLMGMAQDPEFFGSRAKPEYSILDFTATTIAVIHRDGWLSKSKAIEINARNQEGFAIVNPTVMTILEHYNPHPPKNFKPVTVTDADIAEAKTAIDWARNLPVNPDEDYLWNLRVAANSEIVDDRRAGLVASLPIAHRKAVEKETERRQGPDSQSVHFGTVGKREIFDLTVVFIRELQSDYGVKTLVRFKDQAGNLAVWFASGSKSFQPGETIRVKATVKSHDEYNGVKQTHLTRVTEQ